MTLNYFATVLIGLASCFTSCCAVAGTIPAAEFHSTIWFNRTGVQTESFNEGSISYDYQHTYVNAYGETVNDQYVANVQLTGGQQLTVDAHGDYRVAYTASRPEGWATGSIRYYFAVTKKDLSAPDTPVPFLISARAHVSVLKRGPGNESPTAEAKVRYKHPLSAVYENLLWLNTSTTGDSRVTQDRSFEGLRAQPPGTFGTVDVVAQGTTSSSYAYKTGAFQAIADPYIRIDPTFTVIVGGVERLGSEVYALEFSEGIGAGVPEPATFWLLSIGLCSLAPRARRKLSDVVSDDRVRIANRR